MFRDAVRQFKTAFILLVLLTLITGLIYPSIITGIAQLLFPRQANGSLIQQQGKTVGSSLIGQSFTQANYFWGRPSATTPYPYNASNSSGSNLGPSNPDFLKAVQERSKTLQQLDPKNQQQAPVDLVTASGSGLDPEISPLAAYYQVARIARARGIPSEDITALVQRLTQGRLFGVLGEPRVNVLQLNLALDNLMTKESHDPTAPRPR